MAKNLKNGDRVRLLGTTDRGTVMHVANGMVDVLFDIPLASTVRKSEGYSEEVLIKLRPKKQEKLGREWTMYLHPGGVLRESMIHPGETSQYKMMGSTHNAAASIGYRIRVREVL